MKIRPSRGALSFLGMLALALLPSSDACAAATNVAVEHVWVVFKTHFDLGYTDLASNVFTKYRVNMMDGALNVIDQNRALPPEQRFVWTVAGWPLSRAILAQETNAARRARIEQAVREGSLAVHALPGTTHTEAFDLEDFVRSLSFSAHLARDYGRPLPIAGKMTDVPGHSWMMPTVLAHAGIKFIQIGCNSACQYPRFPRLFWWEGPDGSRVLCNYTVDYGSSLTPPPDWPSRHYLAMVMTGDNHGPPTPQQVARVRDEIAKKLPGTAMSLGTLDDFAKAVLAEKPDLAVVRGDTPDTWIHGLTSMPEATRISRNVRPLLPALDSLDTHLKAAGLTTASLAQPLAEAYEGAFLYGEHTWGMNGEYGGRRIWGLDEWREQMPPDRQQRFLQSFDDHRDYIRQADAIARREIGARLELLAKSVKTDGPRVVVWNPLPWPRSGIVEVPGQPGRFLFAENIPASGYRTFSPDAGVSATPAVNDPPAFLDTTFYKVLFDLKRGGIASLVEKKSGRELADRSSPYALGQFLHERFSLDEVNRFFKAYSRMPGGWALNDLGKPGMPGPRANGHAQEDVSVTAPGQPNPGAIAKPGLAPAVEVPYFAVTPGDWTISVARSAVADIATLTARDMKGLAKGCTITFTFARHAPSVEVEWVVVGKTPDKLPEGGWLCFPFACANPQFTLGRPGGLVDPAKEIIPGANRHLYAVSTGVRIAAPDGSGVCLCPIDSPLVSLDKPGLWWWSMDFVPRTPTVFVNLYNNKWNTNFPLWQDGSWSVRTRFWPTADLVAPSWEARTPLLAARAEATAVAHHWQPPSRGGVSVSRPGVLVTAFGQNPDGEGTLLRVWEQAGNGGELTVELPGGFKTAQPVNLRGENTGAPIAIRDGSFKLDLPAYAPASFMLDL